MKGADLRNINNWRKVWLSDKRSYYRINLWNGNDAPHGFTIYIEINELQGEINRVVIEGPTLEELRTTNHSWDAVLSLGSLLAQNFAGLAIVSSHELIEAAQKHGLQRPDLAAYGVFWSYDPRQKSSIHQFFPIQERHGENFSLISCQTWIEVSKPNLNHIAETTPLLIQILDLQKAEALNHNEHL